MYNFIKLILLWRYIVIKEKQVVGDSVQRCLPGSTKILKLTVHTDSSHTDINGKVTHSDKNEKAKKVHTQHIYTSRITAQSLHFSSTCFMASCNPLTPVKWLYPKNTLLASP